MLDVINMNSYATDWPEFVDCNFEAKHAALMFADDQVIGRLHNVPETECKAIYRTDTNQFLGTSGNRYGIADNAALNDQVIQALEQSLPRSYLEKIELKEETSSNGAFCKWTYTFPNAAEPIRQLRNATGYKSDVYGKQHKETWLNFQVSIVNSFSGKTPVICKAGSVDISCLNSLTTSYYDTSKQRHTSSLDITKFGEFLEQQANSYRDKIAIWQRWADKSIDSEQAEQALVQAGISPRLTKQLMDRFEVEATKRGKSIWALASSLTFWGTHNSELFTVRGSKTRDNVAASLDARQNKVTRVLSSNAWQMLEAA